MRLRTQLFAGVVLAAFGLMPLAAVAITPTTETPENPVKETPEKPTNPENPVTENPEDPVDPLTKEKEKKVVEKPKKKGVVKKPGKPSVMIYPVKSKHNFCPQGLQPVTIDGAISCGTPNKHITYNQMLATPAPVKRQPVYHRSARPSCEPGIKGCVDR